MSREEDVRKEERRWRRGHWWKEQEQKLQEDMDREVDSGVEGEVEGTDKFQMKSELP